MTTQGDELRTSFLRQVKWNLLVLLIVIGLGAWGYATNRNRVHDLRRETHERCVNTEHNKAVIHREHEVKLHRARVFLKLHPQGVDGISRTVILLSISDEKTVVRQTKPLPCPK